MRVGTFNKTVKKKKKVTEPPNYDKRVRTLFSVFTLFIFKLAPRSRITRLCPQNEAGNNWRLVIAETANNIEVFILRTVKRSDVHSFRLWQGKWLQRETASLSFQEAQKKKGRAWYLKAASVRKCYEFLPEIKTWLLTL